MTKTKRIVILFCLMTALVLGLSGLGVLLAAADVTPGTVTYVTEETMAADSDNVLADHSAAAKAEITDDGITGAAGKLAYNAEVEGVEFDIQFTSSASKQLFFVLRATAAGSPWGAGCKGYYAFILSNKVEIYKVDGVGGWNDEAIGAKTFVKDIYDGKVHHVKYSAKENSDGKCDISFTLDGETFTGTEQTAPLPITGTSFYTMNNDANNPPVYTLVRGYVPLADGDEMLENIDKVSTDLAGTAATDDHGFIYSAKDGGFTYNEEVQGVDLTLQYTDATVNNAFFYLRAKPSAAAAGNAAVNPDNMTGYMMHITKGTGISSAVFYRVTEGGAWNKEPLGATYYVTGDLFDGQPHRIKFSAVDQANGKTKIRFEMVGASEAPAEYETEPLPIEGTVFHTSANRWAGTVQQFRVVTSSAVFETEYTTVADMLKTQLIKDGDGERIEPVLEVISSKDGVIVFDKSIEAAEVKVKIKEGEAIVFALGVKNATTDGAGYYFMVSKTNEGTKVEAVKAEEKTREVASPDPQSEGGEPATPETETYIERTALASGVCADVDLFDGTAHTVKLSAAYIDGLTFALDGKSVIADVTDDEMLDLVDTKFAITYEGDEAPVFEMHGPNATSFTMPENAYKTYTSKSLLKNGSMWAHSNTTITDGTGKSIATGENRMLYAIELTNAMYKVDLDLSKLGSGWIALCLNANKLDAPWNAGFHSIVLRISGTTMYVEEFAPQTEYDRFSIADVDFTQKMTIEGGVYNVTADNGQIYTFVRVVINGKVYCDKNLPYGAYGQAGAFGIFGFGADWVAYSTEDEIDLPPALINAAEETRGEEEGIVNNIAASDWAPVMNSFAPAYMYEGSEMILGGNGDVAYKNSVNFSKLQFEFKLDKNAATKGQNLQFFFNRRRQEQFITSASGGDLSLDASNYGYGVTLLNDGTVELIKTTTGMNSSRLMSFGSEGLFGINFSDGAFHKLTIYREATETEGGGAALKITLFVDDETTGYSFTDTDYYATNYPMNGFISFSHTTTKTSATIRNVKFEGTETAPETAYKAAPLNFVTYYPDADKETGGIVYFVPYGADAKTKWVEVYGLDTNGGYTVLLGTAFVPSREVVIPDTYTGASVRVVAVGFTQEGNFSVDLQLKDTEADHTVPEDSVERIAVQSSDTGAYFIYANSKKEYIPVGANYMGLRGGDHSTFDAATSFTEADYDPVKTDAMMRAFAAAGGNMLRVFVIGRSAVNPGISGDNTIPVTNEDYYYEGLYIPYMENVAHFLQKAKQYGVYVMITLGDADVPSNSYYLSMMGGAMLPRNMMYLSEKGIAVRTKYAENVTKYFTEKHPELVPAILSIAFQNEFAMNGGEAPFNQESGSFTAPNGKTYDLSDNESRQALFEEGVVFYLNKMTAAVKAVDPNMLVNEGSYTLNIVGNGDEIGCPPRPQKGDARYPARFDVYLSSDIDFLDVHIYFRNTDKNTIQSSFVNDMIDMHRYSETVEEQLKTKCLFMGEFGASKNWAPNWDEENANGILSAHDVYTETVRLAQEAGIHGFAVWTLESHLQTTWWNLLAHDGTLDTLKEMIANMYVDGDMASVTAKNVTGKPGTALSITIEGVEDGDTVWYRTSETAEWTTEKPSFEQEGTHTVYYRVVRSYVGSVDGSATVTLAKDTTPGGTDPVQPEKPKKGCGGAGEAAGAIGAILFAGTVVALVAVAKKRRQSKN